MHVLQRFHSSGLTKGRLRNLLKSVEDSMMSLRYRGQRISVPRYTLIYCKRSLRTSLWHDFLRQTGLSPPSGIGLCIIPGTQPPGYYVD